MSGVVVAGAGQAGLQLAASLREAGYDGDVTLVGDEPFAPYQRPPLSKAYLAGKTDAAGLGLRAEGFYADNRVGLRLGTRATAIDRTGRRLILEGGEALSYEHLVLALGARNRPLPVPGFDLAGVRQLRGLADADALKGALADVAAVAVVGAGFIGLEFAAVAAARGLSVTVIEAADRPMARAVSAEMGAFFRAAHEAAGIRFRFGSGVAALEGEGGRVAGLRLSEGGTVPADLVVVGIGVLPNQEIAREAGLAAEDGIRVDAMLATDDPAISAIGDCARFHSPYAAGLTADGTVRIESVQNAIDQGRCLAARLTGRPASYEAVPWFWSDQGPYKLQMAGLAAPGDASVIRGRGEAFSVFRFRHDRLSAVESVNRPADHMIARRLLAARTPLTPEQAADPGLDLKALVAK
ncbi:MULTISPECIES: FAD-dependent oxidoreductase [Methylobacterium]|uniref:Rhodocoxin reductase n=5 Tax=Pseudomonadota TaxID=1224 RepID=A0ABQ4SVV0_9HYPH|nr:MULTISPECIES: FAD-dependent oxidoreductase [Methylobacterium]PIU04842.1 MAG: pyridine nucleotide-disulfide oxidoreductase [Methylobacterium sp. CG09_land_8_20_14_0_10_71_15]PIU16054.1 MAG: pyridine nucleotide-disulfide oxidoreductase [Methylobacterium sp. CG08_land_8_20_14_0_20_71_15]GBU18674.1 phenylpropionate dioxygenase ferredoxin reductase subunit [Methylobacterium sp.]GJE05993.1 Rhodocoxin reductase [Methylobacterium jeotgali]